ncbi:MAG: hypothetical protein GX621_18930 [Pirellulaceae bacterium]|nr:hypothetical protein [Pirellulaceae bacterium]
MVLCLPILLFVMALMVNFGTMASWRVRELGAARHAVWASRHPRSGAVRPPSWWPTDATMEAGGAGRMAELDDPRVNHPVVRGPLPMGTRVDPDRLDPTGGYRQGSAAITRDFPLLAALGPYRMEANVRLLDREWQHREMGLWSTRDRRMPVIYELPQADQGFVDAYQRAAIAVIYAPFRADLAPLDRDDEFTYYAQRFAASPTFPYRGGPPDFHPRLNLTCGGSCRADCDTTPEYVDQRVEQLVDQIQGNPDQNVQSLAYRMAGSFINLYQAVQRELQAQIDAGTGNARALQTEIDDLDQKIDAMERFRAGISN